MGNVVIIGDSYSTFEKYIPEGYLSYYPREDSQVTSVEQTWWHQLFAATGDTVVMNSSYSGSTICHTGYDGMDSRHSSFVTRLDTLLRNGFFDRVKIDDVYIFGGTNDDWAGSPLGQLTYRDWHAEDLYKVLPAVCWLIYHATQLPGAPNVTVIINSDLRKEICSGLISACEYWGISYVLLHDISKVNRHPDTDGMRAIKEQVWMVKCIVNAQKAVALLGENNCRTADVVAAMEA